jgi:hypothetical protein
MRVYLRVTSSGVSQVPIAVGVFQECDKVLLAWLGDEEVKEGSFSGI